MKKENNNNKINNNNNFFVIHINYNTVHQSLMQYQYQAIIPFLSSEKKMNHSD